MKKKFVCQLLALSMTAVMAVPQAGLPGICRICSKYTAGTAQRRSKSRNRDHTA